MSPLNKPQKKDPYLQADTNDSDFPVHGVVEDVKIPDAGVERWLNKNDAIEQALVSIYSARKLLDRGDDANSVFGKGTTVITTTTIPDRRLKDLDWKDELEIVWGFKPDYHIPTDYSVYETMDAQTQFKSIRDCMSGTEWMYDMLINHPTEVIVQVKGWKPWHFRECLGTMERLETSFCAFYAAGYRSMIYDLKNHVNELVTIINPKGIMLIGRQSKWHLSEMPPEVVATTVKSWRNHSESSRRPSEPVYRRWKESREEELGVGQSVLNSFQTKERGEIVHG